MSELISRQKLIDKLNSYHYTAIGMRCGKKMTAEIIKGYHDHVIEVIKSQPPADVPDTNVGEWIPCSERLPEPYKHVLVTAPRWQTTFSGEPTYFVDIAHCDCEGAFHLKTARTRQYATAWMPLPEPYKGVE